MNVKSLKALVILPFLFTFLSGNAESSNVVAKAGALPNIIFIVADDLGWQDVGFMGSKWFETPNLDKLSSESLVFNQAYMYPTCSASRAMMMTGKHSFRTGVYTVPVLERGTAKDNIFSRWTITLDNPMYSELLKNKGYNLTHIGKWHLVGPYPNLEKNYPFKAKLKQPQNGDLSWLKDHLRPDIQQFYPTGRGFDENVGGSFWGDPARGYTEGYRAESGGYHAPFNNPFIEEKADDEWLTDRLTDEAIDFIARNKAQNIKQNKETPFFINLNFYAPHRPTVVRSEKSLQHFLNKEVDEITGQGTTTKRKDKTEIAGYATMIRSIDENVQRLIEYLDVNNLRENTLIIFTSDNGFNGKQSVNNRLRGYKGSFYEGGIRVPLLVNWPKTIKPGHNETVVSGLDYFPTFMELAGIKTDDVVLDGDSIVPLFTGNKLSNRSTIWHLASAYKNKPATVIRKGKWKFIQYHLNRKVELYNLAQDLAEMHEVSRAEPLLVKSFIAELKEWRIKNNVPLAPNAVLDYN